MAAKIPGNRDNAGRFVKGQSGNPNGRKKMDKETKEILEAAAPEAARKLVEMMISDNTSEKGRLKAISEIMDRVYGKATQPIEGGMDNKVEIVLGGASKYAD